MNRQNAFKLLGVCSGTEFKYPNPHKDDDIVSCAGFKREIGKYSAVKAAAVQAGKDLVDKIVQERFGKKPKWR